MRLATAVLLTAIASAPLAAANPVVAGLDGAWTVDLSTKPGEPYTKDMTLTLKADGTVSGSFYDSTIETGRWKLDRGRTCVSFRTTDGQGPYHSAACLDAGGAGISGQTWAEHRNFLFNWNAARKAGKD